MLKLLNGTRQFSRGVRVGFAKNSDRYPHLIVNFNTEITDQLKWPVGQPLELKIGTNGNAGMIRILPSKDSASKFVVRDTYGSVDLGPALVLSHQSQSFKTVESKIFVGDDIYGADSYIQITLPKWEKVLTEPERPRPVAGLHVSLDPPRIIHNSQELELFEFQAILLAPLSKAIGGIIPADVIIEKGYAMAGKPPHPAVQYLLPTEMKNLEKKLRPLNLSLKYLKGTGYSLHVGA